MSWSPVKPSNRWQRLPPVTMSLRSGYIFIYLGPEPLRVLGAGSGDKLKIERGEGEHQGLLRVSKGDGEDCYALRRLRGQTRTRCDVRFPAWPGAAKTDQGAAGVEHFTYPGSSFIEIKLPPWAYSERAAKVTPLRRVP